MKDKIVILLICYFISIFAIVGVNTFNTSDAEYTETSKEEIYRKIMIAEYEESRNQLAIEVNNYITSVAPKANIDPYLMVDLCSEYGVDLRFVLAQGHVESHFATKGTAVRTLSIFNVGAYDGHSASRQKHNGFGFENPNDSIEPYLKLITNEYMVNGKTESDLMKNYVNGLGKRYASNPKYESMLRSVYTRINNLIEFRIAYENFLESQNNLKLC